MIDYTDISSKLEKLQEYMGYLKEYQNKTLKELKSDHTLQGAVLHYLQLTIECAIDVGELLISALKLRKPEEAREVIFILAENKIIPDEFAKSFAAVAGFRNILVHEYTKVDLDKVYYYLQKKLNDFDYYAKSVANFVKSQK